MKCTLIQRNPQPQEKAWSISTFSALALTMRLCNKQSHLTFLLRLALFTWQSLWGTVLTQIFIRCFPFRMLWLLLLLLPLLSLLLLMMLPCSSRSCCLFSLLLLHIVYNTFAICLCSRERIFGVYSLRTYNVSI